MEKKYIVKYENGTLNLYTVPQLPAAHQSGSKCYSVDGDMAIFNINEWIACGYDYFPFKLEWEKQK